MLYLALALFTAAIVAVDQLTKYLAAAHLVGRTITLIPGWLQLHYITNDGMALSLLRGARWLFVVMTAVYLAVVVYVLVKKWFKKTPELWCIAAITGGAIGNFIDRDLLRPRDRYDLHPVVLHVQRGGPVHHVRRAHPRRLYSGQGQGAAGRRAEEKTRGRA